VEQVGTGAPLLSARHCMQVCLLHCLRKEADVFLLFILGDDAAVQNQSAWKVLVMVVSIILTAACATFLIAIFTLMCWRKHKCKFLTCNQQVCVTSIIFMM